MRSQPRHRPPDADWPSAALAERGAVSFVAVITWLITICFGLFLLGIWLVEYDSEGPGVGASRLPWPVISGHALLGVAGVLVWLVYIVTGEERLARVAALILVGVAVLGLTMAVRWIGVYRAHRGPAVPAAAVTAATLFGTSSAPLPAIPPERNFPIAAVLCHGIFAVATVVLVLLTTFDVFST